MSLRKKAESLCRPGSSFGKKQLSCLFAAGFSSLFLVGSAADSTSPAAGEWAEIRFSRTVEPGSALDFSFLLDAPAGKYGRVISRGEDFVFEKAPSRKIRFYGVNLSFWTNELWSREACDKLAADLAASGYNAVRLHAFDLCLLSPNAPSYQINQKAMAHFDYLLEALKKRGIYTTIDLLVRRQFTAGEIAGFSRPVGSHGGEELKALIPVSDSALENWKRFAEEFLTHINVCSGIAWKDDPSLLPFCLVNENTIPHLLRTIDTVADIKALYQSKFAAWLEQKALSPSSKEERDYLYRRFLKERFETAFRKMRDYIRSLGIKQPLTEQNNGNAVWLALSRSRYDYVDNHFYFDFPRYLGRHGRPPFWISNVSAIPAMNADQMDCVASRLFGKPFLITEYNWTYPSRFRAEMGAIVPAYAALQGWNGLFSYQYTHGSGKEYLSGESVRLWELCKDPIGILSARIGALLFLRGDVRTSRVNFPLLVDESTLALPQEKQRPPRVLRYLGMVGRVGSITTQQPVKLPEGASFFMTLNPKAARFAGELKTVSISHDKEEASLSACLKAADLKHGTYDYWSRRAVSSTGELEMNGKAGTFKIVSPRSTALVIGKAGSYRAGVLEVNSTQGPVTFFAASLDPLPLNESGRILLLHLTDSAASGLKIRTEGEKSIVDELGTTPFLGKQLDAQVAVNIGRPGSVWRIHGLDFSGRRRKTEEQSADARGRLSLKLTSFSPEEPCFSHELILQKQ